MTLKFRQLYIFLTQYLKAILHIILYAPYFKNAVESLTKKIFMS